MIYFNLKREENYPVIKLGISFHYENRQIIINLFLELLNKSKFFFKMDFDSYYHRRIKLDDLVIKTNKKHKKKFRIATENILKSLGCTDLVLEKGQYVDYFICDTPFGKRKIEMLRLSVDFDRDGLFEDYTVGVNFTGYKYPTILDFKGTTGGVENIFCEDYTKHFPMFKEEIQKISSVLASFEVGIMNGRQ